MRDAVVNYENGGDDVPEDVEKELAKQKKKFDACKKALRKLHAAIEEETSKLVPELLSEMPEDVSPSEYEPKKKKGKKRKSAAVEEPVVEPVVAEEEEEEVEADSE